MNCTEIQKQLARYYDNYTYMLFNSYVFDWESDFMAMSKSSYFVEVEVKVTRSDFFRDFGKAAKHRILLDNYLKKTHLIEREEKRYGDGDLLARYYPPEVHISPADGIDRLYNRRGKEYRYLTNQWHSYVTHKRHDLRAGTCRVHISPIEKKDCPNTFFYACPFGLIKPEEVPSYAGLMWVDERGIHIAKRAPFLHKRTLDLSKQLLHKFHSIVRYKMTLDSQIAAAEALKGEKS